MQDILLDSSEAASVLDKLNFAEDCGLSVRVADDDGKFKIKVGPGVWSPPLGDGEARIILLNPLEITALLDDFRYAEDRGLSVRVADDDGSFKVKIGRGVWSPPLGVVEVND